MSEGPLSGVRVLELEGIGPAPMAAMLLAEMGADVVRVDRPTEPAFPDVLDRGRRSVVIDLKHPEGAEAVLRLAEKADILIEGFRPGVAERLGIGPEAALARNPALVYGRMTGWGQTGPRARTAGHDLNYIALTGVLAAIGPAEGPPSIPLNLVGDFGGGSLYLVVGILAAMHAARATGRGQVIDAAIVDGATHLAAMIWAERQSNGWTDRRADNLLDGGTPFYSIYETADGGWFTVGALESQFYAELVRLLDLPEWADAQWDRDRWAQMRAAFATRFATRTRAEWTERFEHSDACAAPVLTWGEAPSDPHLRSRAAHTAVDGFPVPSPAPRFSETPSSPARHLGPRGAHSSAVLTEWGVADAAELLASGTVRQAH
ncbi:alpha-methylacyl-CoA racemase [Actinocorallia herbida]|uniref:Alpha-methylacyl-CoA racemase n=1 Tax=Actinocorallia herbida TaxID=58109 RepID=A0A3N1D2Y7_9ACTN|nr:CaiB/BaiF CoA-transferase family protein [Actinocorallia herbida]ROO87882.1 alpha-methylacyl-CoA racemase [Actinocorallia herbida]